MDSQADLEKEITPLASQHGLRLYDIEMGGGKTGMVLRVYVENASIDEIHKFSKELLPFLTEKELFPETGQVQVSTPGLNRKLKKKEHYVAVIGKQVSVTIQNDAGKRSIKAKLTAVNDNGIETDNNKEKAISFTDIKKASVIPDITIGK